MNKSQSFFWSQIYYKARINILEQQWIQGGLRLGTVNNKIVELQQDDHHRRNDDQLCTGTILLILLLFIEILSTMFCFIYSFVRWILNQQPLDDIPTKYQSLDDVKTGTLFCIFNKYNNMNELLIQFDFTE